MLMHTRVHTHKLSLSPTHPYIYSRAHKWAHLLYAGLRRIQMIRKQTTGQVACMAVIPNSSWEPPTTTTVNRPSTYSSTRHTTGAALCIGFSSTNFVCYIQYVKKLRFGPPKNKRAIELCFKKKPHKQIYITHTDFAHIPKLSPHSTRRAKRTSLRLRRACCPGLHYNVFGTACCSHEESLNSTPKRFANDCKHL